jgi:hypothetical protein
MCNLKLTFRNVVLMDMEHSNFRTVKYSVRISTSGFKHTNVPLLRYFILIQRVGVEHVTRTE